MVLRLTVRSHICRPLLFLWSHTPRQKLRCDCSTMHLFSYTAAGFIPPAPNFIPPQMDEEHTVSSADILVSPTVWHVCALSRVLGLAAFPAALVATTSCFLSPT
ncbi:hypothetical protein CSKR_201328 [Clonorchis sinensis]|uniref:Uncharacterized protein n=1 Tax=Clonorchis sinensis TaxID=79923 RepID=A0A8T1MNP0_CLOSI|nr:hypothetical protein CSKR_201328 [Clonorchis sinensis]